MRTFPSLGNCNRVKVQGWSPMRKILISGIALGLLSCASVPTVEAPALTVLTIPAHGYVIDAAGERVETPDEP